MESTKKKACIVHKASTLPALVDFTEVLTGCVKQTQHVLQPTTVFSRTCAPATTSNGFMCETMVWS